MKFGKNPLPTVALIAVLTLVFAACSGVTDGFVDEAARGKITVETPAYFAETATATVNPGGEVFVHYECFQGDLLVLEMNAPVDENNHAYLILGPTARWTEGNADCVAEETESHPKTGRHRVIARTSFEAIDPN